MDWLILPPLLIPFAGVFTTLLLRKRRRLQAWLSFAFIVTALAFSLFLAQRVIFEGHTFVLQSGQWPVPAGITLVADPLGVFMLVMTQLVLTAGILYATGSTEKVVQYPTFYPLFLGLATGLSGAFLTGDLFNLFVFAEVIVITGATLTGIADDKYGVEAAYKYFLISTVAAVLFLLGVGSLYASYGTLNLAQLGELIQAGELRPLALAGMAFLTATFLTKSAVFPFHFWQPDFHAAAPTAVSAMLSSVVVKLGVYGFLRMTSLLFVNEADTLRLLLVILGVVGVIYGGFGAAGTHNAKRMLAYSTLSQIGFILVGIGWGTPFSIAAALLFTFNHSLIKAAMLMLAGAIASRAPVKSASFEVVLGVGKNSPAAGILFLLGGMALAGIPPTNGFISKLGIFWSGVEAEQYLPLAVIGVASILTLFYVISAFMKIWFEKNPNVKPKQGDLLLAPALLVLLCLALGIWGDPLVVAANNITASLADSSNYISVVKEASAALLQIPQ